MNDKPHISIRIAGPQDAAAIQQMIMALARDTNAEGKATSTPADFLRFGFGTLPLFKALIAETGDIPVGLCLYFYSFSSWLGEPGIYVQDLYVAKTERGTGLGRRLLQETARRGLEQYATHLRLSVDGRNIAAKNFYTRVGMHHRKEEDIFHIGGDAFVALAKESP